MLAVVDLKRLEVQARDGQAGGATEAVSVGRKLRPKEDCLGELGYSLLGKGGTSQGGRGCAGDSENVIFIEQDTW